MNLAEFPLSVLGRRAPGNVKTLHFEDEVWDRAKRANVPRKLTITGSDLLGLPTSRDDEVLLGCVQLTRKAGFEDRKVRFTRHELLDCIGWKPDGKNYRRVSESLDRWAGTLIISDKAFWDKAGQCWVKDSFNILDRVLWADRDAAENQKKTSAFLWGDFMWKSFQAGNLKELDFDFWLSLDSPISKRLYRLLDKRFYHRNVVTFDLHRLAWEKVGLSRKMHTGQIKEKLGRAHDELTNRGVCKTEFVKRGRGKWDVIYGRLGQQQQHIEKNDESTSGHSRLVAALLKRGVKNGQELLRMHSTERIQAAIENFDDRNAHGESLGPGWLGKAIIHPEGFAFRNGYVSKEEQRRKQADRKKQLKADQQQRQSDSQKQQESLALKRRRQVEFRQKLESIPEEHQAIREQQAIQEARHAGQKILADHVEECRRLKEPVQDAGPLRQQLWWDFVFAPETESLKTVDNRTVS